MAKKADKMEVISILADADVLADQHEVFVEKFVTRANDELYLMLGNIMAICLQVEASAAKASVVKEMRNKLRDNFGLKTQSNSRVPSIVVRYIVRSNRKAAHIYGRVIEVAIANNITPEQLPDFIRDRGGIDEIRLSVVSAEEKKANDDKWANARYALSGLLCKREPIGKVVMNTNTRLLTASDVEFSYLICNKNLKTGEIDVLGALYPSSDIETRALELFTITSLAMQHNGTNKFFEVCNENGLNQDILHRWMNLNGFGDDATARNFTRALIRSTKDINNQGE